VRELERLASEQRLARLVEEGEIRAGAGHGLEDRATVRIRGRRVSSTLLEDRG
jgi:hypothetical protein